VLKNPAKLVSVVVAACIGHMDADAEFPCWPCYRDGFDVPNPSAGEE
jgi:hypothetical protein